MPDQLTVVVPAALVGERIDRVVSLLTDRSRREVVDLIAAGFVSLDGAAPAKPSIRVEQDAVITVDLPDREPPAEAAPGLAEALGPAIRHVDESVIIVDKPAGLVVHPGAGVRNETLVQGLVSLYPDLAAVGSDPERPGVVHRLDRGTSGLLMVARTDEALSHLSRQLAERTVERRYLTLVDGDVRSSEGLIDGPLGRSPRDATRQAVVAGGREARTHYEVIERFTTDAGPFTFLACRLETGRTHQIRAHLEAIGHPVSGDERYGSLSGPGLGLHRPFLHAAKLGFEHPDTGSVELFESPLPDDLASVLDELRASTAGESPH